MARKKIQPKATKVVRGKKRAVKKAAPQYAAALEALLVGCGHGDLKKVQRALAKLGRGSEMDRLNVKAQDLVSSFHHAIWSLRDGFDEPTTKTESTNWLELAGKLNCALTLASDTVQRVFQLIELQDACFHRQERIVAQLRETLQSPVVDQTSLKRCLDEYQEIIGKTRDLANEVIAAQSFEDVCAQAIRKVQGGLRGVEQDIVTLLNQLRIELPIVPDGAVTTKQTTVTDQAVIEALLQQGARVS